MKNNELKRIAYARRLDVLDMVKKANAGHIGGSMSCMDILVCLYYEIMNTGKILVHDVERDRFILSKGHCAEALYAVLADNGFISKDILQTFAVFDTILAGHPVKKVNGIEFATGSLGHGLSVSVGMGIALKNDSNPAKIYVLMGDGEQSEGSVWEAVMAASKFKLDNLIAIIDRNKLQISGNTEDIMPLNDLAMKYTSFGWTVRICNGHEPVEIINAITESRPHNMPLLIIAETVKGYGSEVMENKADWHHAVPNDAEYIQIKTDLETRRNNCG